MRQHKSNILFIVFGICIGLFLVNQMSCTHDDQVLDEYLPQPLDPVENTTDLVAKKVETGPTLDGVIDPAWDDAQRLVGKATVPDTEDGLFEGYIGDTYDFTMRAMYTATDIFFLVEWTDNAMDLNRQTWYFDPTTSLWVQESRYPTINANGVTVRDAFYEDKLALLWNIGKSVEGWDNATCYVSCHTGLGEDNGFSRHYTNAPGERIDMWHWKSVRNGVINGQSDDQYQDEVQPNGRHSDAKVSGGYTNNVQEFDLNGDLINIPLYVIPGREYYFWITREEIDAGTAKLITSVDENGVLTYDGGTIDPNTDITYQRDGSTVGASGIPSVYIQKWEGSRGDISVSAMYNGSGWTMEMQRALTTGDVDDEDVDFSSLEDQPFGLGIFDNSALAHAIKANLILKFEE